MLLEWQFKLVQLMPCLLDLDTFDIKGFYCTDAIKRLQYAYHTVHCTSYRTSKKRLNSSTVDPSCIYIEHVISLVFYIVNTVTYPVYLKTQYIHVVISTMSCNSNSKFPFHSNPFHTIPYQSNPYQSNPKSNSWIQSQSLLYISNLQSQNQN